MSTKKKTTNKSSNMRYIVLCAVILFFAVYAVVTLVNLYSEIGDKKQELNAINGEITIQEIKNDEMDSLYNSSDEEFSEYMEQIARDDLDYISQGERVFVNISGD